MTPRVLFRFVCVVALLSHPLAAQYAPLTPPFYSESISFREYRIDAEAEAHPEREHRYTSGIDMITQQEAEARARRHALSVLSGSIANGDNTVRDVLASDPNVSKAVLTLLDGLALTGIGYPRFGVRVNVSLDLLGKDGIIHTLYKTMPLKRFFPELEYYESGTSFTSLIIDARGMDVEPAFFPTLYDLDGNELYGAPYVHEEAVYTHGLVRYVHHPREIESMHGLGESPLRVVAWGVRGRNRCDLVLANDDGRIIMNDETLKDALRNCRVVIIIDSPE